ncbi:hypothetical protein [Streptomyces netropsis]|uniref:Uncharacterized protein n=1 Tax=Streptomyces netropsis TaxID=55404 RepID=A0A7W7LHP8_STRNE|nr:hypothetical protein [Streptomyces netropsis]MBB4890397.1 hypothetical protein [Streptomyces netropsis]
MTKRQQPDRVCVLPGDTSWIEGAAHLEQTFGLLGRAVEVAEDRDDADRYLLPALTYRIAENAIGGIKDSVLAPEAEGSAFHMVVVPAFELDALWKVLEVLRGARDGEAGTVELRELLELIGFNGYSSASRTLADYVADLERVLTVLTLDIPAGRDLNAAFCLDSTPGFDFNATYEQLATVWRTAGINP